MVRRRDRFFAELTLACDVTVVAAVYLAAYLLLTWWRLDSKLPMTRPFAEYAWVLWVIEPAWIFVLWYAKLYRPVTFASFGRLIKALLTAQLLGALLLLSAMYMTKSQDVSRLLLQIFLFLSAIALGAERVALKLFLDYRAAHSRRKGSWHVLLVGDHSEADAYMRLLAERPHWGIVVAGVERSDQANGNGSSGGSGQERWAAVINRYVVDEVVAVSPWQQAALLDDLASACAERGVIFRILVKMPPLPVGRYFVDDMGQGSYMISLETVPQELLLLMAKRLLDILGAVVGLALCALIFPFYAIWLRIVSPGPALFRQERLGRNGRRFLMYKFRTMCTDAEDKLKDLFRQNEMSGAIFKIRDDPRVIPGGSLMRATHLDELPQFFNVLKGDMSLVGTRPPTPWEAEQYQSHHYRRLSMRPGMTGFWQLSGNKQVNDFDEVVRLDCQYIDNWSLWLDAKLLLKTGAEVLKANGW